MGHVIAVIPASGGVGATTLAGVLAVRAGEAGQSVVAVDLDRFGGRLDVVLGVEQEPGWRWDRLRDVAGVVDGEGLARELPRVGTVPVLSGTGRTGTPVSTEWMEVLPDVVAGLAAAHRVTVLDVARDLPVVAAVAPFVDAWVVVVGTGVPQLASAAVAVPTLRGLVDGVCAGPVAGVRRRPCQPWVVLRGMRIEDEIADAVCDHLDAPVVARVRDDARLVSDVTCGEAPGSRGRGPAVDAADEILLRLVSRPPVDLAPAPDSASPAAAVASAAAGAARPDDPGAAQPAASQWRWSA
ncbi:hypothetical protein [Intrasporangium sp.]|uniref:hypothetical protein n=1 Tax=Intrasporangium sp. TaxID=1925024 RepID=UPI00293AC242|nr:hypothetical protein [Intrasporangium sp.]MDV3222653.1 hypothetical protein [Intrasporangium sp.]